jgi:hypothetical protein
MDGRKGGEFSLSLINTNEEVSSLSLTHTHTFIYMCKWVYLPGKVSKVIKLFP